VAGDWLTYVLLLKDGRIAFSPKPANIHRRHQQSVTLDSLDEKQWKEIADVQAYIAELYTISPKKYAAALAYLEQLAGQFNLDPEYIIPILKSGRDRHGFPGLINQRVPGTAAVVDDVVEGFEDGLTTSSGA
jgi:hypothetical protein